MLRLAPWNLPSVCEEAAFLLCIGFSPPLHENDSKFRLIALWLIVCLWYANPMCLHITNTLNPMCLALPNHLIGHNDFIIWVLKWDNWQFFQCFQVDYKYKREEACDIYMPDNCFFKLHSSLFILFESIVSSVQFKESIVVNSQLKCEQCKEQQLAEILL